MGPQIGDALKAVYRAGKFYFTANNSEELGRQRGYGVGPADSG
jgi:hypothetical protein